MTFKDRVKGYIEIFEADEDKEISKKELDDYNKRNKKSKGKLSFTKKDGKVNDIIPTAQKDTGKKLKEIKAQFQFLADGSPFLVEFEFGLGSGYEYFEKEYGGKWNVGNNKWYKITKAVPLNDKVKFNVKNTGQQKMIEFPELDQRIVFAPLRETELLAVIQSMKPTIKDRFFKAVDAHIKKAEEREWQKRG